MFMRLPINFCPTGMLPTKANTPHVPVSTAEIIEQTQDAYEQGISIVHLHARDHEQKPSWQPEIYRDIVEGVRKYCPGLVICLSTSGRDFPEFEKRSAAIELKPDMCSLTLSSLNFYRNASVNSPDMINQLLGKMIEYGVHPEFECFDLVMVHYGKYLMQKHELDGPCYWNLIFGNIAGMQATLSQLATSVGEIPPNHYLALGGIAKAQLAVTSTAVAMGLGVRNGLEDHIWFDKSNQLLATNRSLLGRVHQLIAINQKKLMKSKDIGLYNLKNG